MLLHDAPTHQFFACRFLPLPVVLLSEVPLRGRGRGRDGGVHLLTDGAVVWTTWTFWPGAPSLPGCLQKRRCRPAARGQRPLSPPGGLFHLHGFPRPRGQDVALPPLA